jgi:ribosome-associated translation inhibitor RaiA
VAAPLRHWTPELNEEDEMADEDVATVQESLRLGSGFEQHERAQIVEGWTSLDARLRSFSAGTVEMELSVKERGEASQRTVLEAWISGQARVVATSNDPNLDQALNEVRDDLIRQLTDAKNRTEPRNNPSLRVTEGPER